MASKITTCTYGSKGTNADLEFTLSLYEKENISSYIEATGIWCVNPIFGLVMKSDNTYSSLVQEV